MDHDQITVDILDREDLEWNSAGIVAENEDAIRFGRVVRRRLGEGQTAMLNDVANSDIADTVLACGIKNSKWQSDAP